MPAPTNTQFSLAVHVLTLLGGQAPALVSSDFLSASAGTSPEHVRRVLAPLRRAGLVRSRPGPSGGWQLDGAGRETTLGDIWRAVHGDAGVLGVHAAAPECSVGNGSRARSRTSSGARSTRSSPSSISRRWASSSPTRAP